MLLDIEVLKRFACEACAATYAAGAKPATIPALPGSKVLTYERPPFRYVDVYFTSPIGESFGWSLIYHEAMAPRPVWRLCYGGWYDRSDARITALLRVALSAAYRKGEFIGGRGPEIFTAPEFPGLVYYNHVTGKDFRKPAGRDAIVIEGARGNDRERYWHEYWGGVLIPLETEQSERKED